MAILYRWTSFKQALFIFLLIAIIVFHSNLTVTIIDTKIYAPVVTLSTQDDIKLLK